VAETIRSHFQWEVHKQAFEAAMKVFDLSQAFPKEERYSLTDQIRRSARSVAGNLAEAWGKRLYEGSFVSKLTDAQGEACETQDWIAFAVRCGYLDRDRGVELRQAYEGILCLIVSIRRNADQWIIHRDE
jgi:four helix bundle protein